MTNIIYLNKSSKPDKESIRFIGVIVTKEVNMYAIWDIEGYDFDTSAKAQMYTYSTNVNEAIEIGIERSKHNRNLYSKMESAS